MFSTGIKRSGWAGCGSGMRMFENDCALADALARSVVVAESDMERSSTPWLEGVLVEAVVVSVAFAPTGWIAAETSAPARMSAAGAKCNRSIVMARTMEGGS